MNVRKAFLICIFSLILLPAFSFSVLNAAPETIQKIVIPYGTVASSYWTGLAIKNETEIPDTPVILKELLPAPGVYSISIFDESGILIGKSLECIIIPPGAIHVDLIENYIVEPITGRFSAVIRTDDPSTDRFSATMFMGNNGSSNEGFSFFTYRSENALASGPSGCGPILLKEGGE